MSGTNESERDILIALRSDVQHMTHAFCTFVEEQKICNRDIDNRMRVIEIEGSHPAAENSKRVKELSARVDTLEDFVNKWMGSTDAIEKVSAKTAGWISAAIAITGIVISIVIAVFL